MPHKQGEIRSFLGRKRGAELMDRAEESGLHQDEFTILELQENLLDDMYAELDTMPLPSGCSQKMTKPRYYPEVQVLVGK